MTQSNTYSTEYTTKAAEPDRGRQTSRSPVTITKIDNPVRRRLVATVADRDNVGLADSTGGAEDTHMCNFIAQTQTGLAKAKAQE